MMFRTLVLVALAGMTFLAALDARAQRRDYLTDSEIDIVREAQEIDVRVAVLAKAVERRLAVVRGERPKEKEIWGELPSGTRTELIGDVQQLLAKAINDIDNTAERGRDSKLFPRAVSKLADSCQGFMPQLKTLLDTAPDERERGLLLRSIGQCNEVIEASANVPKESKKN